MTAAAESDLAFFRRVFAARPQLLHTANSDLVLDEWLKEHPEFTEVPPKVKAICDHVKNLLQGERPRRRQPLPEDTRVEKGTNRRIRSASALTGNLEKLERLIDECLTLAKNLDAEGLKEVIQLLRQARNAVVWKQGANP
jgi:hypothetical protein